MFISPFLSPSVCRVLNALLPTLRKQYCALKEAGLSSAALESDFKEIEHLVERKKVVVWADQTTEPTTQNDPPGASVFMTFPQLAPLQTTPCKYCFYFFMQIITFLKCGFLLYISIYRTVNFFIGLAFL